MFFGIRFENTDPKSESAATDFQPYGIFRYPLSFVNHFPKKTVFFGESGKNISRDPV